MAPQINEKSSFYGAMDLPVEEKSSNKQTLRVLVATAFVTVALTAAVFAFTAETHVNSVVDSAYAGDDLPSGPDCQCDGACTDGVCTVGSPTDGQCRGMDGAWAMETAEGSGVWEAKCNVILGRYDCVGFPCLNGGWCVDGVDQYTCICPFGYSGGNCQTQVNECTEQADPANNVCHQYADCTDTIGKYACQCKQGFQGDGYALDQDNVAYGSILVSTTNNHGWLTREDDDVDDGCTDIDDCTSNPCQNGGTCTDSWEEFGLNDAFTCDCSTSLPAERWSGLFCEEDVDECTEGLSSCDGDDRAECTNTKGSFTCKCREFWEGDGLDKTLTPALWNSDEAAFAGCSDVDDCSIRLEEVNDAGEKVISIESPCLNGATCTNDGEGTGRFECFCAFGWEGQTCELDINECTEWPEVDTRCVEHARCQNEPGTWKCLCNEGWTGDGFATCVDADDCEEDYFPCANGGSCTDCGTLCFICDCVRGWRGKRCDKDWNECSMGIHNCHDKGNCVNSQGSYSCECEPGFSGDGVYMCKDVDNCLIYEDTDDSCADTGLPCESDADCATDVKCVHVADEDLIDYVHKIYNDDGSINTDASAAFGIITNAQWVDDYPAVVDNALVHQCGEYYPGATPPTFIPHGGCKDVGSSFLCTCDQGWEDSKCDLDTNECARGTHECARYATCTNTPGSYTCACNQGHSGSAIGKFGCNDIDDCTVGDARCKYGLCTDTGVHAFRCTCTVGWEDKLCDHDENECLMIGERNVCHLYANCINTPGSYKCECEDGYVGDGTSIDTGDGGQGCIEIDDCASSPCENGVCEDHGFEAYGCVCEQGWMDINCDFDVNECYTGAHDCHHENGGKCVNTPGGYYCRCISGYEGDGYTCTDLDDCDPYPCYEPNTVQCIDAGKNSFVCECECGFTGVTCEDDIDECAEVGGTVDCMICENDYGCNENNGMKGYFCDCPANFYDCSEKFDGTKCCECTDCKAPCDPFTAECTTGAGFRNDPNDNCVIDDQLCVEIDECAEGIHNCDDDAICTNEPYGSFSCECDISDPDRQYFGDGVSCERCSLCEKGEYLVTDCTSKFDRVCDVVVKDGPYAIENTHAGISQCLVKWKETAKVFPERYNWGGVSNGNQDGEGAASTGSELVAGVVNAADNCENPICGVCNYNGKSPTENLREGTVAVWYFARLSNDDYLIFSNADGQGFRCLGFQPPTTSEPLAPYPQLIAWEGELLEDDEGLCASGTTSELTENACVSDRDCEDGEQCLKGSSEVGDWTVSKPGPSELYRCQTTDAGTPTDCELDYYCGFETDGAGDAKAKLMASGRNAVWNVHQLGCTKDKMANIPRWHCKDAKYNMRFQLSTYADPERIGDKPICMYYPMDIGSHPRRIPTKGTADGVFARSNFNPDGNLNANCGIYVGDGESQEAALMANGQAAFQLIPLF